MPLYELNGKRPHVGKGSWIAPGARLIGDVRIGERCYIAFGAVIRADFGLIEIGDESIIEDNVVVHCAARASIGSRVIVGHMAMLHDTEIGDCALVGMKSFVSSGTRVGEWSIVAEMSYVKKGQAVLPRKVYRGIPVVEVGDITERQKEMLIFGQQAYAGLVERYASSFREIP